MATSYLKKTKSYEIIPGTPGTASIPGVQGIPGTPGHYSTDTTSETVCSPTICNNSPAVSTGDIGSSIGGSGYRNPSPCSRTVICRSVTSKTTTYHEAIPGTPGSVGTPGRAPTADEVRVNLNSGWNSHSRSIDKINKGQRVSFFVKPGIAASMVSLDTIGRDKFSMNKFTHSVVVENAGVIVFENGVKVKTVKSSFTEATSISLFRQPDNNVVCVISTGSETLVHLFDNPAHALSSVDMYVYAHLYTADDHIKNPSSETNQVHFGEA